MSPLHPRRKPRPLQETKCLQCGTAFKRKRNGKGKDPKFCSHPCSAAFKTGKPNPTFITPASTKAERIRANGLINRRLKLGWFEKPSACMKCGRKKRRLDSHHTDYQKPAHVHWVCRSCHGLAHQHPTYLDGIPAFVCDRHLPARRIGGIA